jgi:hypothetical protein
MNTSGAGWNKKMKERDTYISLFPQYRMMKDDYKSTNKRQQLNKSSNMSTNNKPGYDFDPGTFKNRWFNRKKDNILKYNEAMLANKAIQR